MSSPKLCPQCGMPTVAGARFCRACGNALSDVEVGPATGPVPQTQAPTVALDQTKVDTDGLDRKPPTADSFKTVADRPAAPPASYETIVDRPNRPAAQSGKPFDPNATQIEATSTQYFHPGPEADADSAALPRPGDPAPTSMLSGQPTVNLSAQIADDQRRARAALEDDESTVVPGETRAFIPPAATTTLPPGGATEATNQAGSSSSSGDLAAPNFTASDPAAAQQQQQSVSPAPLRTLPLPPRMVVPNTTATYSAPLPPGPSASAASSGQRKGGFKAWHFAAIAGVLIVGIGVLAVGAYVAHRSGWLNLAGRTTPAAEPTPIPGATAPPAKTAAQLLSEADSLSAAGDNDAALALLREAARLEPNNHDAQRRLGDALIKAGARSEAITAYTMAIVADGGDAAAWSSLAAAQFDEGLYTESVESYRRLVSLGGGAAPAENVQLALADSLRAAGQMDEAKTIYEKIALSSNEENAGLARTRLTELAKLTAGGPTPAPDPTRLAAVRNRLTPSPAPTTAPVIAAAQPTQPQPTVPPTPVPTPRAATPTERYERGVELWSSNRGAAVREFLSAQSVPDANYYLGLNVAEGRDPKSLGRAELVSALLYFQRAQNGPHGAQARRYADALGKEYDRRQSGK